MSRRRRRMGLFWLRWRESLAPLSLGAARRIPVQRRRCDVALRGGASVVVFVLRHPWMRLRLSVGGGGGQRPAGRHGLLHDELRRVAAAAEQWEAVERRQRLLCCIALDDSWQLL